MNICIVGTGYVGLVTGACLAYLGNNVTCIDTNEEKIAQLRQCISPIYEPGLDELLEIGVKENRLVFTSDFNEGGCDADVIYIAVGTPPSPDGSPDMSYVKQVAQSIGRCLVSSYKKEQFKIIINKSTVPVGTGNWVEMLIREEVRRFLQENPSVVANENNAANLTEEISQTFTVVSNPEFLKEGTAIGDTFFPDRIVVGTNNAKAFGTLEELYQPIVSQNFELPETIAQRPAVRPDAKLVKTDLTSAEMIKYAANSFLAMKISFANEIANICEYAGADIKRVVEGIGLDKRIGERFLQAGIGWGGSCFGKDVSALIEIAQEYSYEPKLLKASKEVNYRQRQVAIQKLQRALRIIKGQTIGILGLAFKPETDDIRDAPSLDIMKALLKMGARIKVYDPIASKNFQKEHSDLPIEYSSSAYQLAQDCNAVIVATEWDEFRNLNLAEIYKLMSGSVLLDGRNIFDPAEATTIGFNYISIGREFKQIDKKLEPTLTANS